MTSGNLASAINASCAIRVIRGRVHRDSYAFKDGGIACVLPASFCRRMGAEFVIASDVWELSSLLRGVGLEATHPRAHRLYPAHYRVALDHTDVLIHPQVPVAGYWPSDTGMERMIASGEQAAKRALDRGALHKPRHQMPEGNVSAGSPMPHSDVRSSGSTARV